MSIDGSRLEISVQDQERWRRRMSVTVPASLVREEERKAAATLASRVKMKGFRKGRVPSKMVESRFAGPLRQETLDRVVNEAFRQALAAQNLRPISEGEIEEISYQPQEDLRFSITFDVQPQFEIERLGGFTVERPPVRVTDAHIDEFLRGVREQHGVWKPLEEGLPTEGELVSVRIRKLDEPDAPAAETEGRTYEFTLGERDAIPDVEAAILTLGVGQGGEFTVTFPLDFPDESRRGMQERIRIDLLARRILELPALDDALARQVGQFESLEELRARIREDLERDGAEQAESMVRGQLLDMLIEANSFEVPRSMVERYAATILGDQAKVPKERLEEIMETIRPEAERAVKRILMLDRLAAGHQLVATEAELDQRIEEIASKNDSTPEKVYASLQKAGRLEVLEREITERKVFEFLKQQSDITEAPAA